MEEMKKALPEISPQEGLDESNGDGDLPHIRQGDEPFLCVHEKLLKKWVRFNTPGRTTGWWKD
jgi:hypothetical protein